MAMKEVLQKKPGNLNLLYCMQLHKLSVRGDGKNGTNKVGDTVIACLSGISEAIMKVINQN